ncbi:uncharacterized protein LOC143676183 [Tamandua tetradactyla]|uniref:uncharacterized protein LOC143676183 n=1 Tax=Tamandua tetradactyla TaxID=48850 RepID=UPI0040542D55
MAHALVDCLGEFVRKTLASWLRRRGGWTDVLKCVVSSDTGIRSHWLVAALCSFGRFLRPPSSCCCRKDEQPAWATAVPQAPLHPPPREAMPPGECRPSPMLGMAQPSETYLAACGGCPGPLSSADPGPLEGVRVVGRPWAQGGGWPLLSQLLNLGLPLSLWGQEVGPTL